MTPPRQCGKLAEPAGTLGGSCREPLRRHLSRLPCGAELAGLPRLPRSTVPRRLRRGAGRTAGPHRRATSGGGGRLRRGREVPGGVVRRGRRGQQPPRARSARRLGRRHPRPGARSRRRGRRGGVPRARCGHGHDGCAVRRRIQPRGHPQPRPPARRRARVQPVVGGAVPRQPRSGARASWSHPSSTISTARSRRSGERTAKGSPGGSSSRRVGTATSRTRATATTRCGRSARSSPFPCTATPGRHRATTTAR